MISLVKKKFAKPHFSNSTTQVSPTKKPKYGFLKKLIQKSIMGSLISNGKKSKARSIFYSTMRHLRFTYGLRRPLTFVFRILAKIRPIFSVFILRKGGSSYKVPAPTTFKRSVLQSFSWFRSAVRARKERFYHERFFNELLAIAKHSGETYKIFKSYHVTILQNRVLMRRVIYPYRPLRLGLLGRRFVKLKARSRTRSLKVKKLFRVVRRYRLRVIRRRFTHFFNNFNRLKYFYMIRRSSPVKFLARNQMVRALTTYYLISRTLRKSKFPQLVLRMRYKQLFHHYFRNFSRPFKPTRYKKFILRRKLILNVKNA